MLFRGQILTDSLGISGHGMKFHATFSQSHHKYCLPLVKSWLTAWWHFLGFWMPLHFFAGNSRCPSTNSWSGKNLPAPKHSPEKHICEVFASRMFPIRQNEAIACYFVMHDCRYPIIIIWKGWSTHCCSWLQFLNWFLMLRATLLGQGEIILSRGYGP